MQAATELFDLESGYLPEPVPCAVLKPAVSDEKTLPLCLLLMGGGGSRQNLIDCQPLFEAWWAEGSVGPMVVATPSPGMSYYVEDPGAGVQWESFLARDFVAFLRERFSSGPAAVTGISMGGYGALKAAFSHPEVFRAAAAMQPMMEPGLRDADIGARNRLHHSSGGPARLIGPGRDAKLFAENQPANIARANEKKIRESGLAIYIEAGDEDFVNAHDGAEFLHRVLWELDLSHEYRLVRGADHGGPSMHPRMKEMFRWTGAALRGDDGQEDGFLAAIRTQLKPLRDLAAAEDPTTLRRFGVLPDC